MSNQRNVLVVGGGPAGLVTALNLAKLGHRVQVIEKGNWPRDKACGEGLLPAGLSCLRKVIALDELNHHPFSGIRFKKIGGKECVIKFKEAEYGWGVRRTDLSQALFSAAKAKGIALYNNTRFKSLVSDREAIIIRDDCEASVSFDYLIGADGVRGQVAKAAGIKKYSFKGSSRHSWRQHFSCKPWSSFVEVYWGKDFEAYVTPLSEKSLQLAGIFRGNAVSRTKWLSHLYSYFPELKVKLGDSPINSIPLAYGPKQGYARYGAFKNTVLVGDSYAFWDGISGEGLTMAFSQAEIVGQYISGLCTQGKLNREYDILFRRYRNKIALSFLLGTNEISKYIGFSFIKRFPKLATNLL